MFHIAQARAKCIKDSKDCVCARPGKGWRKRVEERNARKEQIHNLPLLKPRDAQLYFPVANPQTGLFTTSIYSTSIKSYQHFHPPSQPRLFPTINSRSLFPATLRIRIRSSFHPLTLFTLFTRLDTHTGRYTFHTEPLERCHCETKLLVIDQDSCIHFVRYVQIIHLS